MKAWENLFLHQCFLNLQVDSHSIISKCKSKRCAIYQNYLVCKNPFATAATGKTCKVRRKLFCTSSNVTYLISCKFCKEQYVGSAFKDNFKSRFWLSTRDNTTDKDICGLIKHFLTKCTNATKLKTLKLNWLKMVIATLKVSCGVEKSIGKPNVLLCTFFYKQSKI